jgi:tetratricopeptide (TPR) repeat protein
MSKRTVLVVMGLLAASLVRARGDASPEIWQDPEFKKAFLGSYAVLSELEPRVTGEERALLERVYPLMSTDLDAAARQIREGSKPDSTALFDFVLGNIAFQQERTAEAASHYETALTKLPSFRRAWKNLGLVRVRDGKLDDAIHAFTRMIQLGGGDAVSYGLLGYAYSAKQDHLAAEAAYRNALLLEPENVDDRIGLVKAVIRQEKFEEAAGLLNVLIERYPERAEFWLLQASAYVGMKQPLRAAENYEVVARMGKATGESMNVLGDIYVNEGLPNLAAAAYGRALELDTGRSPARPIRNAEVLVSRGANAEARELVGRIRELLGGALEDSDRRTLLKLEARISLVSGQSEEAARILEEVVSLDPLDGDALLLLGQHWVRAGDPQRALVYIERAANIEAFEAVAKGRQGQILVTLGKYDEALQVLRRSQELRPSDQIARYIEQVERASRARR